MRVYCSLILLPPLCSFPFYLLAFFSFSFCPLHCCFLVRLVRDVPDFRGIGTESDLELLGLSNELRGDEEDRIHLRHTLITILSFFHHPSIATISFRHFGRCYQSQTVSSIPSTRWPPRSLGRVCRQWIQGMDDSFCRAYL